MTDARLPWLREGPAWAVPEPPLAVLAELGPATEVPVDSQLLRAELNAPVLGGAAGSGWATDTAW